MSFSQLDLLSLEKEREIQRPSLEEEEKSPLLNVSY